VKRERALLRLLAVLSAAPVSCAATPPPPALSPAPTPIPAPSLAPAPPLPTVPTPDIDIRQPNAATVHGSHVVFDGLAEGLAWPALDKALGPRKPGDVVTIQMGRDVPIDDLLRAAWTVRTSDVHVQSADANGVLHAVELRAKHDGAGPVAGCHLAVFVRPDGSLRVAAPGGPREVRGEDPPALLARSLEDERARCRLAYVAFGAESDASPWGPVFDVLVAVDRAKSAGAARYVLGQAMHAR
jgi:hypothetical protein